MPNSSAFPPVLDFQCQASFLKVRPKHFATSNNSHLCPTPEKTSAFRREIPLEVGTLGSIKADVLR